MAEYIRSLVVISSIIIGVWAGVFILSFAWGLYKNNIDESVYKQLSHIQIHHPRFQDENDSKFTITNTNAVVNSLQADDRIASVSSRVIATGMVQSPTTASGVKIYGINPASEITQMRLKESLREGTYFNSGKDNEILIGEKLAEKT
ncbi:ABC transporter permease [Lacinutrix neustonica]|uniref:ABC transporter permease n=1 Tax=Lacinutrix neustonica TaxID=2980107 RepID=A0A9E8MVP7_9FLAO|nr:ABC transporter permease [Lacinutrix neustonica]WAC02482.1 ABC transporter permease [Lacinutrix neustonica]